jgi:hypothetical protein
MFQSASLTFVYTYMHILKEISFKIHPVEEKKQLYNLYLMYIAQSNKIFLHGDYKHI